MIINNIVIVGGGSAGWMTAAILIKNFPNKNITVIESPNIPPIGVGESTYDGIRFYFDHLEIDQKDFFKYTDASIKTSIEFSNFYRNNCDDTFLFPFGPPNLDGNLWGVEDWLIKKYAYPETPISEYVESYFPQALLVKNNTFSDNKNNLLGNFDPDSHTALHFDAVKFGLWLRDRYSLPRGVKHLVHEVKNIIVSDRGIEKIILDNNQEMVADLFVDCTGFKSILMNKLENNFISYNNILPNNKAWATQIPYADKEKELTSVTNCTAISNGWVWNIPLWSRIGSGYVYSDKYISDEDALKEFKEHLFLNKVTHNRSKEDIESLFFKNINMRVGIYEKVWFKNVVAIGLSAGFIEPLQSNGLFTTHEFLFQLVRALQREKTSGWDISAFNQSTKKIYDDFVNFIQINYALSIRDDSQYWKDNIEKEFDFSLYNQDSHIVNLFKNKTNPAYIPEVGPVNWLSAGMNYFIIDKIAYNMGEISKKMNYKNDLNNYFINLDEKRKYWDMRAKECSSLYEYLKTKYHS